MAARQTKAPAAFLSYAHLDDEESDGQITRLRQRLALAVGVAIGERFEIFQDRADIAWGQHWPTRLDEGLEQALFLIPILTPAFFNSDYCRAELERFLELERRVGRRDLILPLYFRKSRVFERRSHPLAEALSGRQYRDWRELRQKPIDSPEVRQALEQLADEIEAAVHRPAPAGAAGRRALPSEGIAEGPPVHPPAPKRPPDLEPIEEERRVVRSVALRAAPALGADTVTRLKAGAVVYVAGRARDSGWLRIEGEGDLRGYVVADAVEPLEPPTPRPPWDGEIQRLGQPADEIKGAGQRSLREGTSSPPPPEPPADPEPIKNEPPIAPDAPFSPKGDGSEGGRAGWATIGLTVFAMAGGTTWLAMPYIMPTAEPEEPWRDCAECPEIVALPGGTFLMGSPEGEEGRSDNEGPQRKVTVAPFAIGKYEVTFAEWDACVAAGGCSHKPDDRGWGRGRRPVINVSWNDAQGYMAWLSRETGETYRLPSEAEWEYAARAGEPNRYWWGNDFAPDKANCGGQVGETTEVGRYPPNPWGLHDTSGNVWEWVEDRWHDNYEGAPTDGSAWLEGTDAAHVVRGASWHDEPAVCRIAFRNQAGPDFSDNDLGFRVARALAR